MPIARPVETRRRFVRHGEARRRRGGRTFAAGVVMFIACGLLPPSRARISVAYDASLDATRDYWNAVAIDQAGDLVTAGVSLYPASGWDCAFVLAKTDRLSGAVAWRRDLPDCGEDETYESSGEEQVLIDPAGDVVVGRRDIGERLFSVYKFSGASGETLWRHTIGPLPKHGPFVHAVSLDAAGNVVAGAGLRVSYCATELAIVKLQGAAGTELWRRSLRGGFVGTAECEDDVWNQAVAVAVDETGDVIANGSIVGFRDEDPYHSPLYQGIVLKLSGDDGAEIWRGETSLGPTQFYTEERLQSSLAIDSEGDVVITGAGIGPDFRHTLTVEKLSGVNGARLWRHAVAEPGTDVLGLALAVDFRDEIAATGIRRTIHHPVADDTGIVLVKLTGDGNERWRREIDGTAPGASPSYPPLAGDQPLGLEGDAEGNIVLAAGIDNAETGVDFLVAGFDGDTGERLWTHDLDGTTSDDGILGLCQHRCSGLPSDQARALAIDAASVVAVGSLHNENTGPDAVTLVLSVATGDEAWRVTTSGPLVEDQVCDSLGSPCGDGAPATTTTAPSATTTTTSTTTGETTTTLPGEIIGRDCDDGNPCTTADRRIGGVCAGTVVGVHGVACVLSRLAADLCGKETLPRKLRRIVNTGVARTSHLLDKVINGKAPAKTDRWQARARDRLETTAARITKLTRKRSIHQRLSLGCFGQVEGLVTACRGLATQLATPP
jgi:outer membrane protein assembly factor BamB